MNQSIELKQKRALRYGARRNLHKRSWNVGFFAQGRFPLFLVIRVNLSREADGRQVIKGM